MNTLYWYPGCSTCKKAVKWLSDNAVEHTLVDLKAETPSAEVLADLHSRSGLPIKKFFNTSGRSYREGKFGDQLPDATDSQAVSWLAADGMLIKRPIFTTGSSVQVGFRAGEFVI
jgi:arsenate reductase